MKVVKLIGLMVGLLLVGGPAFALWSHATSDSAQIGVAYVEQAADASRLDMPPLACDIDGNGVIDVRDIGYINSNLNTTAPPTSVLADANGDGVVNALDARLCMSRCTLARCAIPPGT